MSLTLFLRKRRVLLAIFLFSLTYFIIATYSQLKRRVVEEEDIVSPVRIEEILKTVKPFVDETKPFAGENSPKQAKSHGELVDAVRQTVRKLNLSEVDQYRCRNSVQGRAFIADEHGYICDRFDLQANGCCKIDAPSTKRHKCENCSPSGCCSLYEQCVSCCLHPQKIHFLRKVLEKKPNNINRVYSLITDHFDLCLTKCRTSSESVRHEESVNSANIAGIPNEVELSSYIQTLLVVKKALLIISILTHQVSMGWQQTMKGPGNAPSNLHLKPEDPACPYSVHWMDSCYQETLLPGAPWHLINQELCSAIAGYLPKQMSQPQRASILARILGDSFMTKYYPDVLTSLSLDEDGDLPAEDEKKLYLEASSWLKSQLLKAAREVGCLPDTESGELSENMKEFIRQTGQTFHTGLSRELYKQDRDSISSIKEQLNAERQAAGAHSPYTKLPVIGGSFLPPAAPSPARSAASSSRGTILSSVKTEKVRAAVYNIDREPQHPSMTSKSIEIIAESVVKLLERSPRRFATVAKRLHGRLLPAKLRTYIWTECIYRAERDKIAHGANIERILRERFGKTVARNVGELKLVRATQCPILRVIENCVIKMYDKVPALASCRSTDMMREAIKALNILYTYDKTYEPYLVLWLFPLQLTFSYHGQRSGPEAVYELAMYLDILNSSLFMQWAQVYAISDLVMHHIKRHDRELHNHMQRISQIDVEINVNDFVVELIEKEKREADRMLHKPVSTSTADSRQLVSDPRIYIRKWIGEGFVGVLDTPAVMFVWDQLFLQDWSSTVLQDFTLVVIILLRERFLLCSDHMSMRHIFLNEPYKLLVADIQKAWLMLHEEASYKDIAACNRVRPMQLPMDDISVGDLTTAPLLDEPR